MQSVNITPSKLESVLRAESTQSQLDDSSMFGIATGSTVARDLDTTASSGPRRKSSNDSSESKFEDSAAGSVGPSTISALHSTTENAYGGGLYGRETSASSLTGIGSSSLKSTERAGDSQSVDGGVQNLSTREQVNEPDSSGDRCIDITGQSYID